MKKLLITIFLGAQLGACAQIEQGPNWVLINKDGGDFFIDVNSIKNDSASSDIKIFDVLYNPDEGDASMVSENVLDCKKNTVYMARGVIYAEPNAQGEVINKKEFTDALIHSVDVDSEIRIMHEIVCK